MIQKKFIGATISVSKYGIKVLIENESKHYKYYKDLGLGYIFDEDKKPVKMTFPKTKRGKAEEPLLNKSKLELIDIAEARGITEAFIELPKRAIIDIINNAK